MATTVSNFTAIDDTAVDAESPITESLMKQLRDNAYWVNAGTQKTSETTANKFLETAGSGVLQWTSTSSLGVNGTKGYVETASTSSGSPNQIAIVSDRILMIFLTGGTSIISALGFVDSSDDSFAGRGQDFSSTAGFTGTADGTFKSFMPINSTGGGDGDGLKIKKNGSNYEFYNSESSYTASGFVYIWL
jgi:hypothetical protein